MDINTIRNLFPHKLLNHETFSVFVEIASTEMTKVFEYISLMTTLSNVDRCPEVFIQHLGELVDFDWSGLLGSEEQRECMKYTWDAHKMKGTKEDLEFMATYGDLEGYQGGRLFVPGCDADFKISPENDLIYTDYNEEFSIRDTVYLEPQSELLTPGNTYDINYIRELPETQYSDPYKNMLFGEIVWGENTLFPSDLDGVQEEEPIIEEDYNMTISRKAADKPKAVVSLPRESLFTFSESTFSGEHYLPDNIVYKEGTILIEVTRLTEEIMTKVETVKPIGMLVVYKYVHDGTYEYITHTRTISEVNG